MLRRCDEILADETRSHDKRNRDIVNLLIDQRLLRRDSTPQLHRVLNRFVQCLHEWKTPREAVRTLVSEGVSPSHGAAVKMLRTSGRTFWDQQTGEAVTLPGQKWGEHEDLRQGGD